ncbi:MAG: minor capsid protein C [Desulfovibrionaceae bacterium]|nr:MAG: minor capsid protein C [Desulfovibrionaceae bacterium]
MRVLELLSQPWAIRQDVLDNWVDVIARRLDGTGPLESRINLATGEPQPLGYEMRGNTAVIRVEGTLVKRLYLFDCGTSTEQVRAAVEAALQDASVRSILLEIDSPGGTVAGIQALAAFLRQACAIKPIYAFSDGVIASAAYWIAAACACVAVQETTVVGSIGVMSMHTDLSGQDAQAGIKRTYLHAGREKILGNDAEPLTDQARASIQALLDGTYAAFLGDVSSFRSLDLEKAGDWADGKKFKAKDALSVGLVDEITTLDAFLERIQKEDGFMPNPPADQAGQAPGQSLPVAQVAAQDVAAAVAAEASRVVALAGHLFGQEAGAKLGTLAASGMSAEQMAAAAAAFAPVAQTPAPASAAAVVPAPNAKAEMLAAIQAAAPDPLAPAQQATADDQINKLKAALAEGMKEVR